MLTDPAVLVLVDLGLVIVGLVLLYFGADFLVRGSEQLGFKLGFTPMIIGIVIVAFGTSAPELAITVDAALTGNHDLALANIVGSNMANIGLVISLVTFSSVISVPKKTVLKDTSFMMLSFIGLSICLLDSLLSRFEGLILFTGLVVYLAYRITHKADMPLETDHDLSPRQMSVGKCLLLSLTGIMMLALGGDILVNGASALATHLGVSQTAIGLTVIAVGSSLPEIAASLVAARIGHAGIALGNVIGSNIWNSLGVLGIGAMTAPLYGMNFDVHMLAAMLGAGGLLWIMVRISKNLGPIHGLVLLGGYIAYLSVIL